MLPFDADENAAAAESRHFKAYSLPWHAAAQVYIHYNNFSLVAAEAKTEEYFHGEIKAADCVRRKEDETTSGL